MSCACSFIALTLIDELYIIVSCFPELCEVFSSSYLILTPTDAAWRKEVDAVDSLHMLLRLV